MKRRPVVISAITIFALISGFLSATAAQAEVRYRRLAGPTAEATAVVFSKQLPDGDTVFIANTEDFRDALAAAPAAAKLKAPLLLTDPVSLSEPTAVELTRRDPKQVIIQGGDKAISAKVISEISNRLPKAKISRNQGKTDLDTALVTVSRYFQTTETVYFANNEVFSDALAIAPIAGAVAQPIILADPKLPLNRAQLDLISKLGAKRAIFIGGPKALPKPLADQVSQLGVSVSRLFGASDIDTALAVSRTAKTVNRVYLTNNLSFPDAMAVAPLAAATSGVLLLTNGWCLTDNVRKYLDTAAAVTVLGGERAMAPLTVTGTVCNAPPLVGERWIRVRGPVVAQPDERAEILRPLAIGEIIKVGSRVVNGHIEVSHRGMSAWVSGRFLGPNPPGYWEYRAINVRPTMDECPRGTAVENGLQPKAIYMYRSVCNAFPEITRYGGRHPDSRPWHPNGLAVDAMIPWQLRPDLGWSVALFLTMNAEEFDVDHVIFEQHIWDNDSPSEWTPMPDRGSISANHYDHVHFSLGRKYCNPACPK